MDVINAAKMISECGSKLNKLAKDIAAQVNQTDLFVRENRTFCLNSVLNLNRNLIWLLMLIVRNPRSFPIEIYSLLARNYTLLSSTGHNQSRQSGCAEYQWRINR